MMYCPKYKCEYRDDVSTCYACKVTLVNKYPKREERSAKSSFITTPPPNKIGWACFWLFIMFASSMGQVGLAYEGNAFLLGTINFVIITAISMAYPFFAKEKGYLMSRKYGHKVCRNNSWAIFGVSIILQIIWQIGIVGGMGALIFYYINIFLFVSPYADEPHYDENVSDVENSKFASELQNKTENNIQMPPVAFCRNAEVNYKKMKRLVLIVEQKSSRRFSL